MTAAARSQTGLKRLAAALSLLCAALFLLAIEQRQAVSVWRLLTDEAGPAAARILEDARSLSFGAPYGVAGPGSMSPRPLLAAAPVSIVLNGEFAAADDATRAVVGGVVFDGANVAFASGQSLRTQPLRIAAGAEGFAPDQTFASRLRATADAQIELRRVLPRKGDALVAPSPLCQGRAPGILAILHRGDRVDLMLFRNGAWIAPASPASDLCGVWSFRAR